MKSFPILALLIATTHAAPIGLSLPPDSIPAPDTAPNILQTFPAWQSLQPTADTPDFTTADALLARAAETKTTIHARLHGIPTWAATTERSSPQNPIPRLDPWRAHTAALISRYGEKITHWEILDTRNFTTSHQDHPFNYSELLETARKTAHKTHPETKIGFSLTDLDLHFLHLALNDGAAGNFDYLSLNPYPYSPDSETHFLTILPTIRQLLASHQQAPTLPVHITLTAPTTTDLLKAILLARLQGFDHIFSHSDTQALNFLQKNLGPDPQYLGHLDLGPDTYALLFENENNNIQTLAAWSTAAEPPALADTPLTREIHFLPNLPPELRAKIAHGILPQQNYSTERSVHLTLGETNHSHGLYQVIPSHTPYDPELKANRLHLSADPPHFITSYLADPTFITPETRELTLTITAKRLPSESGLEHPTGFSLTYESIHGLRTLPVPSVVAGDNQWHEITWNLTDAKFTGTYGFHLKTDSTGFANDLLLKKIEISR